MIGIAVLLNDLRSCSYATDINNKLLETYENFFVARNITKKRYSIVNIYRAFLVFLQKKESTFEVEQNKSIIIL